MAIQIIWCAANEALSVKECIVTSPTANIGSTVKKSHQSMDVLD